MFFRCPKCQRRIGKSSLQCSSCGWNLDQELGDEDPDETKRPGEKRSQAHLSASEAQLDGAVDSISREDYPSALSALNSAIIDADECRLPECYALRGYALLKLRQFDRAEQDCNTALQLGYTDVETLAWRAAARGQLGRWREAYEDLAKARLTADEPTEYADLMAKYYEPAMNWFRQRIQGAGDSTIQAFSDRGWINLYMHDFAKAKRDFELALQNDPHFGPAMLGIAESSLVLGQLEHAVDFCDLVIESDSKLTTQALIVQIRAAQSAGRTRTAIIALQKLRLLAQRNLPLLEECARLRFQIGDYVGCIEDLNVLIGHPTCSPQWLKLRGDTYAAINNPALALADFNQALKLEPNRAVLWVRRGEMNVLLRGPIKR